MVNDRQMYKALHWSGLLAGLGLTLTHFVAWLSPVQLFSLIWWLIVLAHPRVKAKGALRSGWCLAGGFTLPQMIGMMLPPVTALVLLVYFVVLFSLLTVGSWWLLRRRTAWSALGVGALWMIMEWVNISAVPIWGTAQAIARPWSAYPATIAFVTYTGIIGITFVVVSLQALVAVMIMHRRHRKCSLEMIGMIIGLVVITNLAVSFNGPVRWARVKVAAVGWTRQDLSEVGSLMSQAGFDELFIKPVTMAAEQGAKLIVSPELGFSAVGDVEDEWWFKRAVSIAQKYRLWLCMGYYDEQRHLDRLIIVGPDGQVLGQYTKMHLTPVEDFHIGSGELLTFELDDIKAGVMICHDDNYVDIASQYAKQSVCVMAVPVSDWWFVKDAHLQGSIHRAIEMRYGVIRAAQGGISAIISSDGTVLAKRDHFTEKAGYVMAEMSLPLNGLHASLFSRWGYWLIYPGMVGLLAITIGRFKRKR